MAIAVVTEEAAAMEPTDIIITVFTVTRAALIQLPTPHLQTNDASSYPQTTSMATAAWLYLDMDHASLSYLQSEYYC